MQCSYVILSIQNNFDVSRLPGADVLRWLSFFFYSYSSKVWFSLQTFTKRWVIYIHYNIFVVNFMMIILYSNNQTFNNYILWMQSCVMNKNHFWSKYAYGIETHEINQINVHSYYINHGISTNIWVNHILVKYSNMYAIYYYYFKCYKIFLIKYHH